MKIFRKIRQKLLIENKLRKYLIYAIGEIVLVVIGILIALQINNRNEAKKVDLMTHNLFEDVLNELATNVKRIDSTIRFYEKKDSLYYLIMGNKLSYDDYAKNEIPHLYNFTIYKNNVHLSSEAYTNLMNNMAKIPPHFKPVLNQLSYLNNANKDKVDEYNNIISKEVHFNRNNEAIKFSWFADFSQKAKAKKIEYMLHSWQYKNLVQSYKSTGIDNLLFQVVRYRKNAINCYQKLAVLLNKPTTHKNFKIDPHMVKHMLGSWKNEITPNVKYTNYIKDNRLYYKSSIDTISHEIIYLSKSKYFDIDGNDFYTLIPQNDRILYRLNINQPGYDNIIFEKIND